MTHVINKRTPIQEFYSGKTIFVTGVTGFLGKVLVETLLRQFPDISNIYLLIRRYKDKAASERLEAIKKECLLFKKFSKDLIDKLVPLEGNILQEDLGLKPEDKKILIENVGIVFHCAATIRFDEKLKLAIDINVRGSLYVLNLCKEMKSLKALIHVSTAYANSDISIVEEKCYNIMPLEDIYKLINISDIKLLDILDAKLRGNHPRTYSYTKNLAETILTEDCEHVPIAIFRPGAILGTSLQHPYPGFVEDLNSIPGFFLGVAVGLIRTVHYKPDCTVLSIPCDYCVNSMITIAWDLSMQKYEKPPVYNYTQVDKYLKCYERINEHFDELHTPKTIWYPNILNTRNFYWYKINTVCFQIIPSMLIDFFLKINSKKPILMDIQRKAMRQVNAYRWGFYVKTTVKVEAISKVRSKMSIEDQKLFYTDHNEYNFPNFFFQQHRGICKYILKVTPEEDEIASKKLARMKIIDMTAKYVVLGLIIYFCLQLLRNYLSPYI